MRFTSAVTMYTSHDYIPAACLACLPARGPACLPACPQATPPTLPTARHPPCCRYVDNLHAHRVNAGVLLRSLPPHLQRAVSRRGMGLIPRIGSAAYMQPGALGTGGKGDEEIKAASQEFAEASVFPGKMRLGAPPLPPLRDVSGGSSGGLPSARYTPTSPLLLRPTNGASAPAVGAPALHRASSGGVLLLPTASNAALVASLAAVAEQHVQQHHGRGRSRTPERPQRRTTNVKQSIQHNLNLLEPLLVAQRERRASSADCRSHSAPTDGLASTVAAAGDGEPSQMEN